MAVYLILLGGNEGQVEQTFVRAIDELRKVGSVRRVSSLYSSPSWGFESAPFLNAVLEFASNLQPEELLAHTQRIERILGRTTKSTSGTYSARPIDIDLLYCDNRLINLPQLQIPHPLIAERRFTLVPLAEHWADWFDPRRQMTVAQMLEHCPDSSKVRRLSPLAAQ